jgi:HAD superfamily hydrolase (TIGR01509 family)
MTAHPPTGLAAVFFDLDGTLIESADVWDDAVRVLARTRGVEATEAILARTHGLEVMQAMHLLHEEFGWPPDGLLADAAWVAQRAADTFRRGVILRPGAKVLLAKLRAAGVPTALVTSSYREVVEIVLDSLGRANFDAVVCGDEVDSPKPDPEPYLTAARLLDVDIRACIAIEDSPKGAASARASGCTVLYVSEPDTYTNAHAVTDSLVEIDPITLARLVRHASGWP